MSLPESCVTRDEWLIARKELLAEEKAMTRARDALDTRGDASCRWSRSTRNTCSTARTAKFVCSTSSTAAAS